MRTLLKGADILLRKENGYETLHGAYLGVDEAKIDYIGEEKPEKAYDLEKDMSGRLLAPGLINCHSHITDDMQRTAAANIDRGIGKAAPQENASEPGQETAPAQAEKPSMTDFKPYVGRKRRSGTGCISQINAHLFEGRYSPKWPDGKKHARNVYARTREECEEKLKVLIVEIKEEIEEAKRLMNEGKGNGSPSEEKKGKRGKKGRK